MYGPGELVKPLPHLGPIAVPPGQPSRDSGPSHDDRPVAAIVEIRQLGFCCEDQVDATFRKGGRI